MGLVGLAERVTLVGGKLTSEPLPGGGFKLAATLPWSGLEAQERPVE
jgi:signal transduction histidine kinase